MPLSPDARHPDAHALLASLTGASRAQILLDRFGGVAEAVGADFYEIQRLTTPAVARKLKAVHALALDVSRAAIHPGRPVLSSWSALLAYLKLAMAHEAREQFRVLFLDKKNRLIADEVLGRGTVDHAPVYPREVCRRALELNSSAVILAHNHPSGDPTPSNPDVAITRQVIEAGRVLGITVHDHVVVGRDGVASLKSLGLI